MELGQLVVVAAPPADPRDARDWTRALAERRRAAAPG
jgi:hypothetical protein